MATIAEAWVDILPYLAPVPGSIFYNKLEIPGLPPAWFPISSLNYALEDGVQYMVFVTQPCTIDYWEGTNHYHYDLNAAWNEFRWEPIIEDIIALYIPISFTAPFFKTLHIPISFAAPLTKLVKIPISFVAPLTKLVHIAVSFVAPWKSITPPPPPPLSWWEWLKENPGYLIGAGGIMLVGALWPRGKR